MALRSLVALRALAKTGALVLAMAGASCAEQPQPQLPPAPPPPVPMGPITPPPTGAPAPPPPTGRVRVTEFTLENNTLKLPSAIEFDGGSDKLVPPSDLALEVVHDFLDAKPDVTLLRIEGHTDTEGNVAANQALSEKRALTVARWLVGVGVKCERLIPVGFGGTRPVVPNDSKTNRTLNRRIVISIAAVKGKPVSGLAVDGDGKVAGDPCK